MTTLDQARKMFDMLRGFSLAILPGWWLVTVEDEIKKEVSEPDFSGTVREVGRRTRIITLTLVEDPKP